MKIVMTPNPYRDKQFRVAEQAKNILEQEERPKPIAAPVIPFVIGAKAAKGITGLPGKISRTYLKKAANFLSSAKGE